MGKGVYMKYIAHKRNETDGAEQLLIEHLTNTADICSEFAKCINMPDYAKTIGLLHDIGKYSVEFQRRINGENISVEHSTCGSQEAFKRRLLMASFCIAGHHGGLPDFGAKGAFEDAPTLKARMSRNTVDYADWKNEISENQCNCKPDTRSSDMQLFTFITRVLFSCLVDADYLDTENFMSNGTVHREKGDTVDVLLDRLNSYISKWKNPTSKLNILRTQMLEECINAGKESDEKLFTLTVPTGGGKTISSLAFALNYAVKHNKKRIIYVIPYTSIIEQNAEVFRNILGEENVLENHCNVSFDDYQEEIKVQKMLACENWDSPVVVTTAVQFFESLFSNKPSKCRKIHNIFDSVIIFDEAQMLPVDYLLPCVLAMRQLAEYGNSAVVLCTATQPNLDVIFNMTDKNGSKINLTEICKSSKNLTDDFRRTEFRYDGKLDDDELVFELSKCEQVLCVVNKKAHAQKLFSLLENSDDNFHLSTYMYPANRKEIIDIIRKRLSENKPCRVISTSLIEAGVDIDFPTVYRAISGIDSVLQAGGRCNRENKRESSESVVHIFDTDEVVSYQQVNTAVTRGVIEKFGDKIYDSDAIKMYFDQLYYYRDIDKTHKVFDKKGILESLKKVEFATVANKFRLIENNTKLVYISVEENKEEINNLRKGNYSKELFRKLQQYIVNLYEYDFKKLDDACAIEYVDDSFYILSDGFYDEKVGVVFPDENRLKGIFL